MTDTTSNTDQLSSIDWQQQLTASSLALYQINPPKKPRTRLIYDYALQIGDTTLFVLTADKPSKHTPASSNHQDIDPHALRSDYIALANELQKRHQKALKNIPPEHHALTAQARKMRNDKYDAAQLPKAYFVGLMGVTWQHGDGHYCVDYPLNDVFFHEDCVFDLDNSDTLIQMFSLYDWVETLKALPSPSDFVAFLKYHRQAIVNQHHFASSAALAHQFMHDAVFFQRAWHVEKQLQKHNVMVRVSPPIKESVYKKQASIDALIVRQTALSPLWVRLLERLVERLEAKGQAIEWELIKTLLLQSGYTRMKLVEFILSYQSLNHEQKQEGIITHEHSYHAFGTHFSLVIYGQNPKSDLHAEQIFLSHQSILTAIDDQLDTNTKELFLLGIDLSKTNEAGDVVVSMDVYYQQSRHAA